MIKNSGRAADLIAELHAVFSKYTEDYSIDSDDIKNDKQPVFRKGFAQTSVRLSQTNAM